MIEPKHHFVFFIFAKSNKIDHLKSPIKATVSTFYALGYQIGSVSGSGTGPRDPGSRGPAMPDPETFPYEWLGVRQYIYMPCFMSVIGSTNRIL